MKRNKIEQKRNLLSKSIEFCLEGYFFIILGGVSEWEKFYILQRLIILLELKYCNMFIYLVQ